MYGAMRPSTSSSLVRAVAPRSCTAAAAAAATGAAAGAAAATGAAAAEPSVPIAAPEAWVRVGG